jgi:hypothetical protein
MQEDHPPNSRIEAKIVAVPWLVIWIAALVTLGQNHPPDIPFERSVAVLLVITAPFIVWKLFRR